MSELVIHTERESFSSAHTPEFVHEVCEGRYDGHDAAQVLYMAGDTTDGIAPGGFRQLLIQSAFHADRDNLSALSRTGLGVVYAAIDYKHGLGTPALVAKVHEQYPERWTADGVGTRGRV